MNNYSYLIAYLRASSPFSLRPAGILSSLLLAFAGMGEAQTAAPPIPSSGVVAKRLFAIKPSKLLEQSQGAYALSCLGSDSNGRFLFAAESDDQEQGFRFVIFDPKTGKLVKSLPTAKKPKDTVEWRAESRWLPDGRFLYVGVTRGMAKDETWGPQGKVNVGLSLRIINTANGTIAERLIPFDDPSGVGMSKGFCSWTGANCVEGKVSEGRLLLTNDYFLAELDLNSLKTLRSLKRPEIVEPKGYIFESSNVVKNGKIWRIGIGNGGGARFFLTEFDKTPREINEEESGKIRKSQKIEETAHPKARESKFFAREKQGPGGQGDLLRRDGAKLYVTYKSTKTMEVNLGADNADCTTVVWQCGGYFLVEVYASDAAKGLPPDRRPPYRWLIAVASPED